MHRGICIPIAEKHMNSALEAIERANSEPADLIELRLDWISGPIDVATLVRAARKPVIATCRPVNEGGYSPLPDEDRLAILWQASNAGAAYVDIEWDVFGRMGFQGSAPVIASYHNFTETPRNIADIAARIETLPCAVVKFATLATSLADNFRVWDAMARCRKPVVGLCMDELGEASRVLALRMGSLLTFGALERGRESAPGQLTARELSDLYRVRSITKDTKLYGVVGTPIAHSMSPEIHNAAFRELGLDAAYLRFRVDDFSSFLKLTEPLQLQGLSVTIPHKQAALAAACAATGLSTRIGAANTLSRTPDGWACDNTDCHASMAAIADAATRAGQTLAGARALVVGAGGASRAIVAGLVDAGCAVAIVNRTHARAVELAAEFGATAVTEGELRPGRFDIIANTTSVGMHPHVDETPVNPELFGKGVAVFDAVYNPRETRMLREAAARGAAISDGVRMFVGQAARQFEIWTGRTAPVRVMEEVVLRRLACMR